MYTSETSVWFPMLQLTEEKTIFCYSETRVVSRFLGPQRVQKSPSRSPVNNSPESPQRRIALLWTASKVTVPSWPPTSKMACEPPAALRFWNGPLKGCENTCGTSPKKNWSCHWKGHRNVKLKCTRCEASEGIDVKNHAWVLPHIPA